MAEFVCGVRDKNPNYLSACKNLPEYRDKGYCVLHFPGEEKKVDFERVKQSKPLLALAVRHKVMR